MKLFAIFILHKKDNTSVTILQNEFNLGSFGYFQRSTIKSFLVFSAATVTERTDFTVRQTIELEEHVNGKVHVHVRSDGLASVVISTHDYPMRVAHILMNKIMDEFAPIHSLASWEKMVERSGQMRSLSQILTQYQDPQEADPLMRLQNDLDETKEILVKNLEAILERGQKLDDMIGRSDILSVQAKAFYRTAKKHNQCCTLY